MYHKLTKILSGAALAAVLTFGVAMPVAYAAASTQSAKTQDPRISETDDPTQIAEDIIYALRLKKTGQWAMLSLVVAQVVIFAVKKLEAINVEMKKWGTLIVLVLSGGASVLSSVVGGMNLSEAMLIFFFTGAPKIINDLVSETGILSKKAEKPNAP